MLREGFFSPNFIFYIVLLQLNGYCWLYLVKSAKNGFLNKAIHNFFGSSWANTINNVIIVTSCVCICRWLVFIRAHSFLLAFTHIHDGEAAQIAHRWEESKISQQNKNLNLSLLFAYVWLSITFIAMFNDNFFENM